MMEIYIDELKPTVPDEFEHNFQAINTIASGSFGTVIRAVQIETNREVAVKVIRKDRDHQAHISKLKQEITILKQLQHKNIVEFLGFIETSSKLYIIMEYINHGTLKYFIEQRNGHFLEEEASKIIECLLSAVDYLHIREICHRDIKPENVMFNDFKDLSSLKLVDFGLSAQYFEVNEEFEFCGTLLYMAPEQIEKRTYSKAIDIWSVGIIMFMLLNKGQHPFYTPGEGSRTYLKKLKSQQQLIFFYNCSEMARNLLLKLLERNPSSRYTAEKALKHPWITRRVYDDIPQTFFERMKCHHMKKSMTGLIGAVIFLFSYSDFSRRKNRIITKEYIEKVQEYSKLKKENVLKLREKSFFTLQPEDIKEHLITQGELELELINNPPNIKKCKNGNLINCSHNFPTIITIGNNETSKNKSTVNIRLKKSSPEKLDSHQTETDGSVHKMSHTNSPKMLHKGNMIVKRTLKIKALKDLEKDAVDPIHIRKKTCGISNLATQDSSPVNVNNQKSQRHKESDTLTQIKDKSKAIVRQNKENNGEAFKLKLKPSLNDSKSPDAWKASMNNLNLKIKVVSRAAINANKKRNIFICITPSKPETPDSSKRKGNRVMNNDNTAGPLRKEQKSSNGTSSGKSGGLVLPNIPIANRVQNKKLPNKKKG